MSKRQNDREGEREKGRRVARNREKEGARYRESKREHEIDREKKASGN